MPAPPNEIELKLQLAPAHVDRFRRSAALSKSVCTEVDIDNVYFDTRDRLLQRHRMTLRVRQIGRRWLQTLKVEGKAGGAVSRRGEWETPAQVLRGEGRLNLARLAGSPLPDLLAQQSVKVVLQPVFHTRVRRAQWLMERAGATIEVALDIGEISAEGERGAVREAICEVELELKRGEPAALIDLALELLEVGGKQPPALTPVVRSKAERGYQLEAQRPATAVKASAKAFVENVTRKATTASALRTVVAHGLAVVTANIERLLRYDDPEYVHQSRVALRRVRSAIRLFDREHRDVPRSLSDELQWLARALGEARDWDVIAEETLPPLAEAIGVETAKPLVSKADHRRRQARARIHKAARSARYAALVLNGERWCMSPAPADAEMLADTAAPALRSASKKLFKAARFFAALTPTRRHQVRILAKRLRYALDLFAVALPKQAAARYVDALSELQDALGQLNDASVAIAVLPQLTKSLRIRESVQQRFALLEPDRVLDIESRLLKLSKLEAPWA
ncbi:MAG: CHAD domain-containing protein [Pseudomonadota bacterium]|nr:CHAD domain-containing protein [Burkholderiaceae bacterium]MDQ3445641.1 CHAD domain-containing protein [Pseudomonadota bacterium]